ncbi:LysR family transcriptional regulator [Marinicauda salina]|uniref:LysR family transcriptional regulator n=1 Tax=Marinicauda salina TaxID=2135793 RepID=A0A2U2BQV5_9PROT|nr:LysR family transcriptional regulator [Marinicauda salina]PWE16376.1 LysR family transcriptional regulator [Marinicauda salina]
MDHATHLRSLQALELAVRAGSLKAAAERLGVTPAAVGQRIRTLEDYLGVDLLVRGRSGIRPAPALKQAMPHLKTGFAELDAAAGILELQRLSEIHILADPDWAALWLEPRLDAFRALRPNTEFRMSSEAPPGAPDCEIRLDVEPGGKDAIDLFTDYLLPVSSPENTRRINALDAADRLEGFPLLHLDAYRNVPGAIFWPDWIAAHGYRKTAPERGIRYARIAPALEAVRSDAALAICGLALAAPGIETGDLSLPFPATAGAWLGAPYRARFRRESLRRPPVARFRDWLVAEGRKTQAMLEEKAGA